MANEHAKECQERKEGGEERRVAQRESAPRPAAMPVASPFTLMRRFIDDLDRLFGFFPGLTPGFEASSVPHEGREAIWVPPVEVVERNGELVIRADVPGLSRDQLDVEVEDGHLVISGERRQEHEERRGGFYQSERSYGSFSRAIPLPEGANPEQAKATFTKGVLEIRMPLPERPRARRLEVQEASQEKQPQRAEARSA